MTQAELLLEERRPEDALDLLKTLPRKHTAALRLELKAHQQTRQWDNVTALLPELERRGVVDAEQAARLRTQALAQNLRRKGRDGRELDEAWKKMNEAQKRETPVALAGAQCYLALGRGAEAQAIIEQSLEAAWDSELVALYAEAAGRDPVKQIERAESWLENHPNDGALLIALGKLCARQALWGKAESYLEAAVAVDPTYAAHFELARLTERLGNVDAARRHYREALELALQELKKKP
jgi:HemY protein